MLSIREIQGESLLSVHGGQQVVVRGVVTGSVRRGFFIQTPNKTWDKKGSDGIFVYSPDLSTTVGAEVEVVGECINYFKEDDSKPVTQIHCETIHVINMKADAIEPIELCAMTLGKNNDDLAIYLNSLEGMLVSIPRGSTFIAPSNRYGDYVLALPEQYQDEGVVSTVHNGVVVQSSNPLRWFPGFRVTRYDFSQRLNVGSVLQTTVKGPLNFRVESYQIAVSHDFDFDPSFVELTKSKLEPSNGALTILTLNCFNLDPHLENEDKVMNPHQDVDDDWGDGRFHTLAQAIVLQANTPDIVALQEIQDNDGAELSQVTHAGRTYELLIKTIEQISGLRYKWVDVEPELGADGGQPGGNIRNGFLYNPRRVDVVQESLKVLGKQAACFEGSRKPLVCGFVEKHSGKSLTLINVHLASKRHQSSIFAPENPGVDAKLPVRKDQAAVIEQEISAMHERSQEYYVTGDFNDGEASEPLRIIVADHSENLVYSLKESERFDYNHRGKLQVLMHGIVPKRVVSKGRAEYEIIHGNELIGIEPSSETDKPSDHAYVIAKIHLS